MCYFFQNFYLGFVKKLKQSGKGDIQHHKEIPEPSVRKLNELLILLQKIMNCKNKDDTEYKMLISKLPKGYQDSYHKLLQWSMIYVILFAFARRASEGVDALTTRHFEKVYDEENTIISLKLCIKLSKIISKFRFFFLFLKSFLIRINYKFTKLFFSICIKGVTVNVWKTEGFCHLLILKMG